MKPKTGFILLWYINWLLLALGLVFFVLYLRNKEVIIYLISFVVFLLLYAVSARVCEKNLQTEGGYSLMTAIHFYINCTRAGYRGTHTSKDEQILLRTAKRREDLAALSKQKVYQCYLTGKNTVQATKNPLLKALWKRRSEKKPK